MTRDRQPRMEPALLLITRRKAIAAFASIAALPLTSRCAREAGAPESATPGEAEATALLDDIANSLLHLSPETATSLGIDVGSRADLRSELAERSADGQQRIANQLRRDLERANAFNTSALSHPLRTSFEVVRSAYATALARFSMSLAFSTAIIESRTPPTRKPISHGCSRMRGSSMASSDESRLHAQNGSCRRRSC
jgi:hypothetical protein